VLQRRVSLAAWKAAAERKHAGGVRRTNILQSLAGSLS